MSTGPGPIVSLFGPTAVGKTSVALELADALAAHGIEAVAISADAFQLYRGLEILSGAPSAAQRKRLHHLLVASHALDDAMSAGRFAREAHAAIDEALATGCRPLVIGGSGLYMQAALTELEMRPPAGGTAIVEPGDTASLHGQLQRLAPKAAAQINPADHYRSARALALAESGDRPEPGEGFWDSPLRHPTLRFALVRTREELYRRIDERVDAMVAAGAADEVRAAQGRASATARRIIGFDELPAGEIEEMKLRTRRYAKRQLTWVRRLPDTRLIDLSNTTEAEAAAQIAETLLGQQE